MTQNVEEHHGRAADHFNLAAEHHRAAETASIAGDHQTAAHEAHCAHGHCVAATDHADLAAMGHVEQHDTHSHSAAKARKK